jgi:hypothetical protein
VKSWIKNILRPDEVRPPEISAIEEPDMSTLYPAARYHATQPPALVASKEEDKALGPGWYDHPSKVSGPVPPLPEPQPEPGTEPEPEPELPSLKADKETRGF